MFCTILMLMSAAAYSQDVIGKWITEGGDSHVEIYKSGDKLNGKTYKCAIWIEDGKLKVRGYLGVFYETQTWNRK